MMIFIWTKNRKAIPAGCPSNEIESDISLTPTVVHQTMKKGLRLVNIIPARYGFSIRDELIAE